MHYTEMFKKDIEDWIIEFVSVYSEKLGSAPCPFAKKAMMTDAIEYKVAINEKEVEYLCKDKIKKPILIIGMDPLLINGKDFTDLSRRMNSENLLKRGYIGLHDHPDNKETIAGVKMNQGKWACIIIQKENELGEAREILKKTSYYDVWTNQQEESVEWK